MRDARSVLDYLAWIEHCAWVQSVCDTPSTAMAAFGSFRMSASAQRGRSIEQGEPDALGECAREAGRR